ncbi:Alpha/Beta hydrolase protein [Lipomyces mesembrius]
MPGRTPEAEFRPPVRMIQALPASRLDSSLVGFEHRYQTIDGIRLHYISGGKVDGDVVVLLAGYPESWYAWRRVLSLLATTYKIIAPDLPGQGDSDRPGGGYDM